MAQIETKVLTGENNTPNGAAITIKNDEWTTGAQAKTSEATVNFGNDSFKTEVKYDESGILGTLSGTTKVGPFTFAGSVNTDGTMTGSGEAKFGANTLTVTPDMATYGFKTNLGTGTVEGKLSTTNEWSLGFTDSIGGRANYGFSSGYASSSGYFFNANIFSMGG